MEEQIQADFAITQEELLTAQTTHAKEPEVEALLTRLRKVFFGEEDDTDAIDVPEGMDADKFYSLFCQHIDVVDEAFNEAVKEVKASTPNKGDRPRKLGMLMLSRLEAVNAKASAKIGLDEDTFRACLMKYQADSRFLEKIVESQRKQEAAREALLEQD